MITLPTQTTIEKNMKTALMMILTCLASASSSPAEATAEQKFEQDRKAILAMVGTHKVGFNFHESYSLDKDYKIKEKKYQESAHEVVLVAEDSGKQIVLQHLLQFHKDGKDHVVKHWSQVWTYEDTRILDYQGGTEWQTRKLAPERVAGTWSQLVTQIDESPRYESYGKWHHQAGISQWNSQETARPLPRREYTKRSDYDILMAHNTHIVAAQGWVHEQSNKKLVQREGEEKYLALERGFNTYTKAPDFNDQAARDEWAKTKDYWKIVRHYWFKKLETLEKVAYVKNVESDGWRNTMRDLLADAEESKTLSAAAVAQALDKFMVE